MFYSQFILAKKGPLGTIWIAAHLERKLRKNQVADTDIGVSVDSIIFPDVPIALRLSSHLLLGVVRIYSRKVSYLFDDCSEALLKVKQAFRSSAVDLPPEESTAPYHSITLPETFDLDDFELPDSDIFQGNYFDHHVSAKEQITLQDTMDGVVYSTSQFGLDERFGDGCQIGLDLNEETLLGQAATPMNDGAFNDDPLASPLPMTPLEAVNDEGEVLDTKPESSEYAEAPATPMLVEESNLSSAPEALISDDHQEPESTHGEMEVKEVETKEYLEPAAECMEHGSENGSLASPSYHPKQGKSMQSASQCPDGEMVSGCSDVMQNGTKGVERTTMLSDGQTVTSNSKILEADGSMKKGDAHGLEVSEGLKNQETSSVLQKDEQSKFAQGLQPCNSSISHQNESAAGGDEQCLASEVAVNENQAIEPASRGKAYTGAGELLDQFYNEALKDISANDSSNMDPPAPEKLLSVSDVVADKPNILLAELTPDKEGLEEGSQQISGRKRTLAESAASMQSNSLETLVLSKSRRTAESIPDDDDLLSSILVGRRSSVLKMKPTPAPIEVISSKRPRAQRGTASKRKAFMDENMVLHGDMIRQQLMSTEDLRRVRKKAPCTLSEISIIQRQFLEDEIFSEPILTGISTELFYMHKETYDVSGTKIYETDRATAAESSVKSDVTGEADKGVSDETLPIRLDAEVQAAETFPKDQNYQDEELVANSNINESEMLVARGEFSDGLEIMEVDEGKEERANAPGSSVVTELDMAVPVNALHEDSGNVRANMSTEAKLIDVKGVDSEPHVSSDHTLVEQSPRKDSSEANVHTEGVDAVAEHSAQVVEEELRTGIDGLVDAGFSIPPKDGTIPSDCGYLSTGPAAVPGEEDDLTTLADNNEDAEKAGRSCADAVDEADIGSSSMPKHDGNSIVHEVYMDNALIDDEAARFHEDLYGRDMDPMGGREDEDYTGIVHDTDFLNVDDDEVNEDDEHLSDAEDSRLLDNSGWSSRTRAVANYLQTLFDREAVRGKSTLPMDSLLVGKTRKEASRMFFESLVLKTRDYIQVEQPKPFDNINLKPRSKLMKSQF